MNKAIVILLLLVLVAWVAAQCGDVWIGYLGVSPPAPPLFPNETVNHPAVFGGYVGRGGVELTMGDPPPAQRHITATDARLIDRRPWISRPWEQPRFRWPHLSRQYGYSVFIPFWLIALAPAVPLAWKRWVSRRRRRMRGFEIQRDKQSRPGRI